MADLTTYTSFAAIRAVLGVSVKELSDTVLALPRYYAQFQTDADDIDGGVGGVLATWDTVAAIDVDSRTAQQRRFYSLVGIFASYSAARECLASVEMFAPQQITDGKAAQVRADPYETLREGVAGGFSRMRSYLATLVVELDPTVTVKVRVIPTFITSAGINLDPVTNT